MRGDYLISCQMLCGRLMRMFKENFIMKSLLHNEKKHSKLIKMMLTLTCKIKGFEEKCTA